MLPWQPKSVKLFIGLYNSNILYKGQSPASVACTYMLFLPLITIVQLAVIIFDDMVFERYNLVKQLEYPKFGRIYI